MTHLPAPVAADHADVESVDGVDQPVHLLHQMRFRDVRDDDECVILEVDNRPDLANVRGALQGGLVATLVDYAAGRLAARHVRPDQGVTTADMNLHFLASIIVGPARAEARMVRAGRRLSVIAVDVTDRGADRLATRATLSFAVLDPR